VIFNPVPGPPMGKHTRLSFRAWLADADLLRVQLYSLSNGYHRHLTLTGLPQRRWLDLAVDMTQARRPDGTGGPLSENERIDDIQLYAPREATLFVRDIVLHDAAPPGERRPFPARTLFTGWFDTGRHPQEWPGAFAIVGHRPPLTWKCARSVLDPATKAPWVQVGLRGSRPVRSSVEVRFRYHLDRGDALHVEGVDGKRVIRRPVADLVAGKWAEATLPLPGLVAIEEVRFRAAAGATLEVDDVLVYESGGPPTGGK
jgi:hypothetical protein